MMNKKVCAWSTAWVLLLSACGGGGESPNSQAGIVDGEIDVHQMTKPENVAQRFMTRYPSFDTLLEKNGLAHFKTHPKYHQEKQDYEEDEIKDIAKIAQRFAGANLQQMKALDQKLADLRFSEVEMVDEIKSKYLREDVNYQLPRQGSFNYAGTAVGYGKAEAAQTVTAKAIFNGNWVTMDGMVFDSGKQPLVKFGADEQREGRTIEGEGWLIQEPSAKEDFDAVFSPDASRVGGVIVDKTWGVVFGADKK